MRTVIVALELFFWLLIALSETFAIAFVMEHGTAR
jgi:hypothetical protein